MRIIAKKTLQNFWEKYPNSKQSLLSWYQVFDRTTFTTPNDVKSIFSSADYVGVNKFIFNICGNQYRLIVQVNYITQIVYILFVGMYWD
jgi:mRNA interferase HigB